MTFLTRPELEQLTGYVRPSAQIRKLREWGIEPFVSARGEVFVAREALEEAQRRRSGMEARAIARKGPRPRLEVVG